MFRISRSWLTCGLFLCSLTLSPPVLLAQGGSISMSVFPALAPNVFGSPSFTPWESNSITALQNGFSSNGNPSLPSFYQQITNGATIPAWVASEFPSWLNYANPGTVFGPAYAGELGNRLYFNLHINGNGQQFSLSQLEFQALSSDPANFLGFSVTAGSYNYGTGFVGLNYGPDGIKGNGDDFFVTSGLNTQLINELFARGSGNAPSVLNSDPGITDQDKINNVLESLPGSFIFSGTYTLNADGGDINGNAFVVVGVPEPSTIILAGVGGSALAFGCIWKRKKRRQRIARKSQPVIPQQS